MANEVGLKTVGVRPVTPSFPSLKRIGISPKIGLNYTRYNIPEDDRQYAKDLGDLLLGDIFGGTKELRNTLDENGLGAFKNVPLLNRVLGTGAMIGDRFIEPMMEGDFAGAGLNAIETIGYSLDTVANPIKSLMPRAGGGKSGDFARSMGWIEGEYRKDFEWDTGNFLVDLAGEMLSDPINWVTFGAAGAAKSAGKSMTKEITESLIKTLGDDVVSEVVLERMARLVTRSALNDSDDFVEKVMKELTQNTRLQREVAESLLKAQGKEITEEAIQQYTFRNLSKSQYKQLSTDLRSIYRSSWYKQYTSISKYARMVDTFDKTLLKASVGITPVGWVSVLYKHKLSPTFKATWNRIKSSLNEIKLDKIMYDAPGELNKISTRAFADNQKLHKEVYDKWDKILYKYNMTVEGVQRIYTGIMQDIPLSRQTPEYVKNVFINKLKGQMKGLHISEADTLLRKIGADELIQPGMVDELVEAVEEVASAVYAAELKITDEIVKALRYDMEMMFKAPAGTMVDAYNIKDTIKYIDSRWLTLDDTHYGFERLKEYLVKVIEGGDKEALDARAQVLNYFGITLNNADEVSRLVTSADPASMTRLRAVLEEGKTGRPFIFNQLDSLKEANVTSILRALNTLPDSNAKNIIETGLKTLSEAKIDVTPETLKSVISRQEEMVAVFRKSMDLWNEEAGSRFGEIMAELVDKKILPVWLDEGELTEALNSVGEFLTKSIDTFDVDDMKHFMTDVDTIYKRTTSILNKIEETSTKSLQHTQTVMQDLRGIADRFLKSKIYDNAIDVIQMDQTFYHIIMSAQGRYTWIDTFIFNNVAEQYSEWFTALQNPFSTARQRVFDLAKTLDRIGYSNDAGAIRKLIYTIDNHTAMNKLLGATIDGPVRMPSNLRQYIRGEMFNQIDANKWRYVDGLRANYTDMVDNAMANIKKHKAEQIKDTVIKYLNGDIPDAQMSLEDLGVNIPGVRVAESITDETLENAIENEMARIRNVVEDSIKTYVDDVYRSSVDAGIHGKLFQPMSGESNSLIYDLALDKDDLIKALGESDELASYVPEYEHFTQVFAGTEESRLTADVLKDLKSTDEGGMVGLSLRNTTGNAVEDSVANKLVQAFRHISDINADLAGSGTKGAKKMANIEKFYSYSELTRIIREADKKGNIYTWSTENGLLSFKKDYDIRVAREHNISPKVINASGEDYIQFYSKYTEAFRNAQNLVKEPSLAYLEQVEAALIYTYSRPSAMFGPVNPRDYFSTLDNPTELLAWDRLTRSNISKSNQATYTSRMNYLQTSDITKIRTLGERREYYQNPWMFYEHLDSLADNAPFNSEDAWTKLVMDAPSQNALKEVYDGVTKELQMKLKTTDDLLLYQFAYTKWIDEDVSALKHLDHLTNLDDASDTFQLNADLKDAEELRSFGLKPGDKLYGERGYRAMYKERANWLANSVANMDAKQLRTFIDKNTDGAMLYVADEVHITRKLPKALEEFRDITTFSDEFKFFNFTPEQLHDAGLIIEPVKDLDDVYFIRRTNLDSTNTKLDYVYNESLFEKGHDEVDKIFEANKHYMNMDDMDVPNRLLTGQSLDEDLWEALKDDPHFKDYFGDSEIRKQYQKMDKRGSNSFYNKKFSRPNFAIIGGSGAFNRIFGIVEPTLNNAGIKAFRHTTQLDKAVQSNMIGYIQRANKLHKYTTMFFNSDYALSNARFTRMFEGKTDKQIKEVFDRGKYSAVILREDKKGRPVVHKLFVDNREMLDEAIKSNAIIVPAEVYRNMMLSVNQHKIESALLAMYRRTIVGTFKSMWLASPGFVVRNSIDSMFYKNLNEVGGLPQFTDMVKYELKAGKMLDWYNDIQGDILKMSAKDAGDKTVQELLDAGVSMTMNKRMVSARLAKLSIEEREMYQLIDIFMMSGASGGFSKNFETFLTNFNKKNSTEFIGYAWEELWNEKILHGKCSPVEWLQTANSWVEQSARFGLFLNLVDNGATYDDAIARVIRTHFDYSFKTAESDLLEQFFWFSTFPINNIMYYVNEGLTRTPTMLKLQMDAHQLSWDNGEYTYDDVRKSSYLMYNAMVGNIRIGDKVWKTGSSVFDFFSIFLNPSGEMLERLMPFASVPLGIEDSSQLNPFNSIGSRITQIMEGKSYLPSMYSKLYQYEPRTYFKEGFYGRWTKIYGPHAKKFRPRKPRKQNYLSFKYYNTARVYRTYKRLKWKNTTTAISPNFWTPNTKLYNSVDKFRRTAKKMKLPTQSYDLTKLY